MSEESLSHLAGEADDVASLAATLVRIPSENPPGEERRCAEFAAEWFAQRDVDATVIEDPETGRPSVGARVGSGSPALVCNGHTDVVPAGDLATWTHDPYAGTVADGRLYGRGAADMKTGLAIAMLAARDLSDELRNGSLQGLLVVHAAMGEETGDPGTRSLLDAGYGGDAAVVLEPTDFRVATSAKGVATYRIGVSGDAAHASHPEQATSAIQAVRDLLDAIEAYDERLGERVDPLCGRAYASITELVSGVEGNMAVIPDRAELLLDRRILPGESFDTVESELDDLLEEFESGRPVTTDRKLVQHYASASIPPDHPLATRFRRLSARRTDAPDEPWGMEASTDARVFVQRGTPAIVWGPGSLDQAHTTDEWISLEDARLGLDLLTTGIRETLEEG